MPQLTPEAAAVAARPAPRRIGPPTPRVLLVLITLLVVGVVLYMGRHALSPFIIGALLIYLLDPAVGWFSRLRLGRWSIPRWLAVLIVYAITGFLVVEGLLLLLGPLVSQLLDYLRDFPTLLRSFEDLAARLGEMYRSLDLPPAVREFVDGALADLAEGAGGIDFGALLPIAQTIAGTAASFFGFLIIPIWAFYLLRDRVSLTQGFLGAFPPSWRDEIWAVITIVERVIGRWIRGQLLLGLIVGGATFAGLLLLGWLVDPRFLQFAVLLAVIAGILELLPIIGPIISMIPTLLLALTTQDPVLSVIAVLILYIAVQQIENNVLVPKIQGDAVELHPSLVIFALVIGGAIAGLLGAILAIPITAAAKDVYSYMFLRLSDDAPPPAAGEGQVVAPDEKAGDVEVADPHLEELPPSLAGTDAADAEDLPASGNA